MSEIAGGHEQRPRDSAATAAMIVAELTRRGETVAVAESLTGGLVAAELIGIPGASAVVNGAVVAYNTAIKSSVLGVNSELLARVGAVDPTVAQQMADGVRSVLAVRGASATYGLSTTGVAGPDSQDGQPPGTVYIGLASHDGSTASQIALTGDRAQIRADSVYEALSLLWGALERRDASDA